MPARRPGRGEAADRRVLEGLREVAEDEPVPRQRRFGLRAAQAGSQGRGQRAAVDLDSAQAAEVEADQALVGAAQRLDAADDAGPAPEGDDRDALAAQESRIAARRSPSLTSTTASGAASSRPERSLARST